MNHNKLFDEFQAHASDFNEPMFNWFDKLLDQTNQIPIDQEFATKVHDFMQQHFPDQSTRLLPCPCPQTNCQDQTFVPISDLPQYITEVAQKASKKCDEEIVKSLSCPCPQTNCQDQTVVPISDLPQYNNEFAQKCDEEILQSLSCPCGYQICTSKVDVKVSDLVEYRQKLSLRSKIPLCPDKSKCPKTWLFKSAKEIIKSRLDMSTW